MGNCALGDSRKEGNMKTWRTLSTPSPSSQNDNEYQREKAKSPSPDKLREQGKERRKREKEREKERKTADSPFQTVEQQENKLYSTGRSKDDIFIKF